MNSLDSLSSCRSHTYKSLTRGSTFKELPLLKEKKLPEKTYKIDHAEPCPGVCVTELGQREKPLNPEVKVDAPEHVGPSCLGAVVLESLGRAAGHQNPFRPGFVFVLFSSLNLMY